MEIGSKVLHVPSGDVVLISKINVKTFTGKSIINSPSAKQVRVNKSDCVPYEETIDSAKVLSRRLEEKQKPSERDPQAINKQIAERLAYFNKQMGL